MDIFKLTEHNMLSSVKTGVTNLARLPLDICHGTEQQRYNLAQSYSDKLAERLHKLSKGKSCDTVDFSDALNSVLYPQKVKFNIKQQVPDGSLASIKREIDYDTQYGLLGTSIIKKTNADIVGYDINLKLNDNGMLIKDKANAIHEARHLFDYICNPKTIQFRSFKFLYDKEKLDIYNKTYNLLLNDYSTFRTFKSIKKEVNNNLSKMSDEDAINTLQSIRRGIRSEQNAYKDEQNFMKKNPVKYAYQLLLNWDFRKTMRYGKKLEFLNGLLEERLKSARANNKKMN